MTCEPLQPTLFPQEELTSFAGDSPAKTSAWLESALASKVSALVSGASMRASLASYDRSSLSWRTSQACLVSGWEEFSETWPRSGMMRSGTASQLPPSAPITAEIAYGLWATPVAQPANGTPEGFLDRKRRSVERGSAMGVSLTDLNLQVQAVERGLWPTPQAHDAKPGMAKRVGRYGTRAGARNLNDEVQMWPTPTANRRSGLQSHGTNAILGQLNPRWVEWLMGYPDGWTELPPSATRSSRKSPNSSAARSSRR